LISDLLKTWKILNQKQVIGIITISILSFCLGLIEVFALYSLYALLNFFINPDTANNLDYIFGKINNFSSLVRIDSDNYFLSILFFIIFIFLIRFLFSIFAFYKQYKFVEDCRVEMNTNIFKTYLKKNYSFFINTSNFELIRNINQEIGNFCNGVLQQSITIITEIMILLFIISYLSFVESKIVLLVILVIAPIFILYFLFFKNRFGNLGKVRFSVSSNILKSIIEPIQGIKEIKIFNSENIFIKKNKFHNNELKRVQMLLNFFNSIPRSIIEFILILVFMLYLILGDFDHNISSETLSIIGLFGIATIRLLPSLSRILNCLNIIKSNFPSIDIIYKEISSFRENNLIHVQNSDKKIDFNSKIFIKNISFQHENSNQNILSNYSEEIERGKITTIFGASGAGKSTLVDLISGLIKYDEGDILIDNKSLKDTVNVRQWQNLIAYVPQKIYLMDESIKKNIIFDLDDKNIDEKLLVDCTKKAEIYDFIVNLPDKFETNIGDLGSKVSGGQIQRIGIARALYKKKDVLIFDEATNSIDPDTEVRILSNLKKDQKNKTIIMISHNIGSHKISDKVIELRKKI